MFQKIKNRFS